MLFWTQRHAIAARGQAERKRDVSVNWVLIVVGVAGVVLLLLLLVGAGVLFWLLRRAGSKKA
jgi:hypothetical protein